MAFTLGERSRAKLERVHHGIVGVVNRAIVLTRQDFCVHDGVRTVEQQRAMVASGASKTMKSRHLVQADGFGHAVDLVPWINGQPRWEWKPIYVIAAAMRRACIEQGVQLTWGGVWDRRLTDLPDTPEGIEAAVKAYCARHPGPDFIDGPHYEL